MQTRLKLDMGWPMLRGRADPCSHSIEHGRDAATGHSEDGHSLLYKWCGSLQGRLHTPLLLLSDHAPKDDRAL